MTEVNWNTIHNNEGRIKNYMEQMKEIEEACKKASVSSVCEDKSSGSQFRLYIQDDFILYLTYDQMRKVEECLLDWYENAIYKAKKEMIECLTEK